MTVIDKNDCHVFSIIMKQYSYNVAAISSDMKVLNFGIKKEFIDRYDASEVLKDNHLTPEQIAEDIAATL
jgi:deoxyxylulose-5-phosphate synthase